MAAVTNGAELVQRLKDSGTPDGPLEVARDLLRTHHAKTRRVATADQVLDALLTAHGEEHGTVRKARSLVETGEIPSAQQASLPIEELLLGRTQPAPDVKDVKGEEGKKDDGKKADGGKPPATGQPAAAKSAA